MDLSYGPKYDAYREQVSAFLADGWRHAVGQENVSRDDVIAFRRSAIAAGYLARTIPRAYGGAERTPDALEGQVIREEFGRVGAPLEPPGVGTMMLVPTLLEHGSEWQKERFVERTMLGEIIWCQGYSEPGSGSDLASVKTRGELRDGQWVVNGQKIWTSSAHRADFMFCLVRTEPEQPKHGGISYLLLDMKQPGIDVRPLRQMTGTSDFNEVFFTDATTPADWIVGQRGEGWRVSRTTLRHERNSLGNAEGVEALFRGVLALAKEREVAGRPALEDTAVRQQVARIDGYIQSHRFSGFRQMTAGLKGESAGRIELMNKLHTVSIGHEIARLALDLLGEGGLEEAAGAGRISNEAPRGAASWTNQYMLSLGVAVAGGTSNIQRNIIAERGLGLPRDSFADLYKK